MHPCSFISILMMNELSPDTYIWLSSPKLNCDALLSSRVPKVQ